MSTIKNLLNNQTFIDHVPFTVKQYQPQEDIIKESDEGRDVFLILSGEVQVCTSVSDNEHNLSPGLARLHEGDTFGELSLFDGEPRSAQVVALEESEIVKLDGIALLKYMDQYPEHGYLILREIFEHIVAHIRQNNIRCKTVLQLYMMENGSVEDD